MRIFVLYSHIDKPFGGANQFIRALKHYFLRQGVLTKSIWRADAILLNSHSLGGRHGTVFQIGYLLRALFPSKVFIHRIDGPVQLYGDSSRAPVDENTYNLNSAIADGTIFQSHWSQEQNRRLGMPVGKYELTVPNAADPVFFYPNRQHISENRIRLIATSWSDHPNKGFDIYQELDRRLDWSRFSMTFVGRTPYRFQNITIHEPVSSRELGSLLRSHDIYVTASKNDACSNALLEALACGLPTVARNSGGHPELVGQGGELFTDASEAIEAIQRVAQRLLAYRQRIVVNTMEQVGATYASFIERIIRDVQRGDYVPKRLSLSTALSRIVRGRR